MIRALFIAAALLGAGKKAPAPKKKADPAPKVAPQKDADAKPDAPKEEAANDPWEFDKVPARVSAHGDTKDDLSGLALQQLGLALDGTAYINVSAHANSVGGVTLTIADANDTSVTCDLYANKKEDHLVFEDSRCSFPVFSGSARTTAICRKITGTARRTKETVLLEGTSPDCTAAPMGVSLTVRAKVKPKEDK